MARYKEYSYDQGKFIPVFLDKQILPGTLEFTLSYLIDNEVDMSILESSGTLRFKRYIRLFLILFLLHSAWQYVNLAAESVG